MRENRKRRCFINADPRQYGRTGRIPFARLGALIIAFLTLSGLFVAPHAEEERFFRIGTAGATGTYFQIGGIIASAISSPTGLPKCERGGTCGVPGLIAVAQTTQGSLDNISLLSRGELDSALIQADVASAALQGIGSFQGKAVPELRAIAALFPESVHIIVRRDSKIGAINQLRGARVALGEKQSGTFADSRVILEASGMEVRDVKADYSPLGEAVSRLRDNVLDAVFIVGGDPIPAVADLAATTPLRFLPISPELFDKLKQRNRLFEHTSIPADLYPEVAGDTPTVGISAIWVVSKTVSDQLVYEIAKSLWNETTQILIASRHPMGSRITRANALNGFDLPLHPGAERYYREIGMLTAAKP